MSWGHRRKKVHTNLPTTDAYLREHPAANIRELKRKSVKAVAYALVSVSSRHGWWGRRTAVRWYENKSIDDYEEGVIKRDGVLELIKKLDTLIGQNVLPI